MIGRHAPAFLQRRLLDRRRHPRRDLRHLRARPAAQCRDDGDRELRPGRVHGDRRLRHGDPRRERPAGRSGWRCLRAIPVARRRRSSSAFRRFACGPTISQSPRSPSPRSCAIWPTPCRLTARQRGPARLRHHWVHLSTRLNAWLLSTGSTHELLLPLLIVSLGRLSRPCPRRCGSSAKRRGAGCSGRSARTRTPRAHSGRTRSSTSCSRSRSLRRSRPSRDTSSRSTSRSSSPSVRTRPHDLRLRSSSSEAWAATSGSSSVRHPADAARRNAVPRPSAERRRRSPRSASCSSGWS